MGAQACRESAGLNTVTVLEGRTCYIITRTQFLDRDWPLPRLPSAFFPPSLAAPSQALGSPLLREDGPSLHPRLFPIPVAASSVATPTFIVIPYHFKCLSLSTSPPCDRSANG